MLVHWMIVPHGIRRGVDVDQLPVYSVMNEPHVLLYI
jgi:hypothetical protein